MSPPCVVNGQSGCYCGVWLRSYCVVNTDQVITITTHSPILHAVSAGAVKRSIGSTTGFHNHEKGPY